MRLSWLENAYSCRFFRQAILTCKVCQTDVVFGVRSGFIVGLCMQDYKSLCAVTMICAILVKIQTHRDSILTIWYKQLSQPSWKRNFKMASIWLKYTQIMQQSHKTQQSHKSWKITQKSHLYLKVLRFIISLKEYHRLTWFSEVFAKSVLVSNHCLLSQYIQKTECAKQLFHYSKKVTSIGTGRQYKSFAPRPLNRPECH